MLVPQRYAGAPVARGTKWPERLMMGFWIVVLVFAATSMLFCAGGELDMNPSDGGTVVPEHVEIGPTLGP